VAGELKRHSAARAAGAQGAEKFRAALDDDRNSRERDYVVNHRRLAKQSFERGKRRLEADHPAAAFDAFEHRGFLAADVGAGAEPNLQLERLARAKNVRAQIASRICSRDRLAECATGVRILRSKVDVTL